MPSIDKQLFGRAQDGCPIDLYTLSSNNGLQARVMTYGATLVSLRAPDRHGDVGETVLGFDDLEPYLGDHPYFGGIIGRYANRIANGRFTLNGKTYQLTRNDAVNHLHGGKVGFDRVIWNPQVINLPGAQQLVLCYLSRDGEEGYTGNLKAEVIYTVTDTNELRLDYAATTDQDTVVNMTQHAYFNLAAGDTILDHTLQLNADRFLPIDQNLIPTGEQRAVADTPMDFRRATRIGSRMSVADSQLETAGGYDHNWILNPGSGNCVMAAQLYDPLSGRLLLIETTQPGIQFYSGNFLDGRNIGRGGRKYFKHAGCCLETQHFPDSPNHSSFPSTVLKPQQLYRQTTIYRFETPA